MADELKVDGPSAGRTCPWCGASAAAGATACPSCGASLAERESLGGVVIPGVTAVDPVLQAFDAEPLHLTRPSPSQGLAGGSLAAAALGGPAGLAALGGLAAVAAVEYATAGSRNGADVPPLDALGQPSEAALQMARQLDASGAAGPGDPSGASEARAPGGEAVAPAPGPASSSAQATAAPSRPDGGWTMPRDPWLERIPGGLDPNGLDALDPGASGDAATGATATSSAATEAQASDTSGVAPSGRPAPPVPELDPWRDVPDR